MKAQRIYLRASKAILRERIGFVKKELFHKQQLCRSLEWELETELNQETWNTLDNITRQQSARIKERKQKTHDKKFQTLLQEEGNTSQNKHPQLQQQQTVHNLSDKPIATNALKALEKGLNFAIAPSYIPTEEIITGVEATIRTLPEEEAEEIRQQTVHILKKSKPPKANLTKEEQTALKELTKNKDIIVTRADKGNATVIMNKVDYNNKIQQLLNDQTYQKAKRNPTTRFENATKKLINESTSIDAKTKKWITPQDSRVPKLYGLPKIHKKDVPLRPIVSSINGPTYNLAKYLSKELSPHVGNTTSFVKNTADFVEKTKDIITEEGDILVSFDVESLFTKVPLKETLEYLEELFPNDLAKLFDHCLKASYFLYNGEFYEQKDGVAMGSPLSPKVANFYMEKFEEKALETATLKPKIWLRYVDDVFAIWQHGRDKLQEFIQHLNSIHLAIKFTVEEEKNNELAFLDVKLHRETGKKLQHNVYRKPTHTNKYIRADSHHHPAQKKGVIHTLAKRARIVCHEENLEQELEELTTIFQENGYNKQLIKSIIRKTGEERVPKEEPEEKEKIVIMPYVQNTTDRIGKLLRKHNIKPVFKPLKTIKDTIPSTKDKVPLETEGVYKITCSPRIWKNTKDSGI
ncbi:uncharacterized protein LOC135840674 [Planococcus citri]|uniref:uncharacterized protein LOC135840674 n=1 Tax=Planococcus citri TaxID=170843 RepID=UPI0031F9EF46